MPTLQNSFIFEFVRVSYPCDRRAWHRGGRASLLGVKAVEGAADRLAVLLILDPRRGLIAKVEEMAACVGRLGLIGVEGGLDRSAVETLERDQDNDMG